MIDPLRYTPKPLVEEHHHIRELIARQDARVQDRNYHKAKEKAFAERSELIEDNKPVKLEDFWCERCKKDFKGVAFRQIENDWNDPSQQIAFYKTKCFHGHWCIRFITDKFLDPYWHRSKSVRMDRANHSNDLLQSFEEGYQLLYGKKNK